MLPAAASAGSFTYYGPQLGFSQGPDQFVVGGHLKWNAVAPQLDFVPGVEVGFGDNFSMVSMNGDFHYKISSSSNWQPYVGAGVGVHFASLDNSFNSNGNDNRSSDTRTGGHFIVGAGVPTQGRSRFFTELKLGFGDSPDMKVMAGWNYRPH
jgi:opacity protein-like surface antigen